MRCTPDDVSLSSGSLAQHGLDFDDVGNTWPARDVEHGAALEDIDPRGFVS